MKNFVNAFFIALFLLISTILYSQSWEESMGSGMGEIESRVRSNRVKKEMENNRNYYNPMPAYDFVPPAGWTLVSRNDNSKTYMLGHTTIPGVIITTAHQITNIQELINQSQYGFNTEEIQLQVSSQMNWFDKNGISMTLIGYSGGYEIKAYLVSITNGLTGGVTILTFTYPHLFTQKHVDAVNNIARGIKFL